MNITHIFQSLGAIVFEMAPYILLGFLFAGLLNEFVKPRTMARHLSGRGLLPVVKAAALGVPLPLCSCGVLPTAVSLRRRGASRAASTSFLIATPQTGVDSIAATYSLLGLPFALIRPVAALLGAVAGGWAVGRFGGNEPEAGDAAGCSDDGCGDEASQQPVSFPRRLLRAVSYGFVDMVGSVGGWLVVGLVVAALITVTVPDSFFTALSDNRLLAMLAVVVVAVPMYVCATGSIPIAMSLMMKGLSPGIAFVMLMAGPAANFASVMILSRTNGRRATAIYIASVVITAIGFGLVIDCLLPASWFALPASAAGACHAVASAGWFPMACGLLLIMLLVYSLIVQRLIRRRHNHKIVNEMNKNYRIKGMNCPHCSATVERTIRGLEGVEDVSVDLAKGVAHVRGTVDDAALARAVELAGFSVE